MHPDKISYILCKNFPGNSTAHTNTYLQVSSFHPKSIKSQSNSTYGLTTEDPLQPECSGIGSSSSFPFWWNLDQRQDLKTNPQTLRDIALDRHSIGNAYYCQVIYSQFGLAIHQNDHQARRRFVEWAQNEIAVVPDFHKRILFSDETHFWLNGYVNKQNCRIWSESNPQAYGETPLHPEKLTVWCALWAGGIFLQKR
ncbi:putative DD41D transposase [Trichonephila clavipes]|nr:putative DD41D transposase [Trichonephila clavipes]